MGIEEPSEELVNEVLAIAVHISRAQAIEKLKAHNNSLNDAVDALFNQAADNTHSQWDEQAWSSDPQGTDVRPGDSFVVQGEDDLGHHSLAPTRPPSRANGSSPLRAPTSFAQEDADFKRAVAESAAAAGVIPEPENETSSQVFMGPATRAEYDEKQWALVRVAKDSNADTAPGVMDENADLPPSARKRKKSAPTFLWSIHPNLRALAGLLTIYARIPLIRNLLLSYPRLPLNDESYGSSPTWWRGAGMQGFDENEEQASFRHASCEKELPGDELHRLMAFVDGSDRSFAMIDNLTYNLEDAEANPEGIFWDTFRVVSASGALPIRPVTSNLESTELYGDPNHHRKGFSESVILCQFTLDDLAWDGIENLYEVVDNYLWRDALNTDITSSDWDTFSYLAHAGEVLSIQLKGPDTGMSNCQIPPVLYTDRWMEENKELARVLQKRIHVLKKALSGIERQAPPCTGKYGCRRFKWGQKNHDVQECLKKLIEATRHMMDRQKEDAQWRYLSKKGTLPTARELRQFYEGNCPYTLDEDEQTRETGLDEALKEYESELKRLLDDETLVRTRNFHILRCLQYYHSVLTFHKDEPADSAIKKIHDDFVREDEKEFYHPEYWTPRHKYLLRGIIPNNRVIYICVRTDGKDHGSEKDDDESSKEGSVHDQWWRIASEDTWGSPRNGFSVMKMDLSKVLIQALTEFSGRPTIVYATEKALKEPPAPLSAALQKFVSDDNRGFAHELFKERYGPNAFDVNTVLDSIETPQQNLNLSRHLEPIYKGFEEMDDMERWHTRGQDGNDCNQDSNSSGKTIVPTLLTKDALGMLPVESSTSTKRKHSNASSIATLGSGVDVPMKDDRDQVIVEHVDFEETPEKRLAMVQPLGQDEGPKPEKAPEMQQRSGSSTHFVTLSNQRDLRSKSPLDAMDLDIDEDRVAVQPAASIDMEMDLNEE